MHMNTGVSDITLSLEKCELECKNNFIHVIIAPFKDVTVYT